jgi:AraC-like DNA-binding protein
MPNLGFFLPIAFGVIHGLLFAVLLSLRGLWRRQTGDVLLAALLVAGSVRLLPYVLGFLNISVLWNEWMFLPLETGLLIGPLFWLYLRARTNHDFRLKGADGLHLIPFLVFAVYRLSVFSRDADFVFDWVDRVDLPVIQPTFSLLTGVSLAAYLVLSMRLLGRFRRWLDGEFSDVRIISLQWLRSFVLALGVAVGTSWTFGLLEMMGRDLDAWQAWWPFATNTAALYYLSIAGLLHAQSPHVAYSPQTRVTSPRLTGASKELDAWKPRLLALMESDRPYLRPDLVLDELAAALDAPKPLLSQVINEGFGMNFRSFVNAYRVEAVRHALDNDSHLTLVGIALDHGFASKATFNRVFKQLSGMTPRQYAALPKEARDAQRSLIPA